MIEVFTTNLEKEKMVRLDAYNCVRMQLIGQGVVQKDLLRINSGCAEHCSAFY